VEVQLLALLILTQDGDDWSASHPNHFMPREKAPITHWTGQHRISEFPL